MYRKPINDELLLKRYLDDKISTYKLVKEFGVCNSTLRNRLRDLKVEIRGAKEAQVLIPHISIMERLGYDGWYKLCQSESARKKRSISHTGKKFTEERKINMRIGIGKGINNKSYKQNAKYKAIHAWMCKNHKKIGICSYCGSSNKTTHWANLDWKYNRLDIHSWLELCPKCNLNYDKSFDFRTKLLSDLRIIGIDIPSISQKNTFLKPNFLKVKTN